MFGETDFARESDIPVAGIIEPGVGLIHDRLSQEGNSVVIIAGTETTISEDSHRKALLEKGIADERIITQACPELQSYIERDPFGEDTEMLIGFYVSEAIARLPDNRGPVYLSLNCSHYGYSEKLWAQAFRNEGTGLAGILNPNYVMDGILVPERPEKKWGGTAISYSVHSRVAIRNRASILNIFKEGSPGLAEALENYILDRDLF